MLPGAALQFSVFLTIIITIDNISIYISRLYFITFVIIKEIDKTYTNEPEMIVLLISSKAS